MGPRSKQSSWIHRPLLLLQNSGNGYKVLKANNDVLDGIRLVGMLLNLEKIVFASSCKETIKEFASYIWDEKALERGEDKPVKQFDHCCDAVRYLCSTIIGRKAARFREIRR